MLLASILRQPSVNAVSRQNLDIFPCVTDPSLETFSCPSPHVFKSMKPWPGIIPLFPPSALVLWRFYKRGLSVLDQHTGTAHNRLNISFHLGKKKQQQQKTHGAIYIIYSFLCIFTFGVFMWVHKIISDNQQPTCLAASTFPSSSKSEPEVSRARTLSASFSRARWQNFWASSYWNSSIKCSAWNTQTLNLKLRFHMFILLLPRNSVCCAH